MSINIYKEILNLLFVENFKCVYYVYFHSPMQSFVIPLDLQTGIPELNGQLQKSIVCACCIFFIGGLGGLVWVFLYFLMGL